MDYTQYTKEELAKMVKALTDERAALWQHVLNTNKFVTDTLHKVATGQTAASITDPRASVTLDHPSEPVWGE